MDSQTARRLADAARRAPSADNSQPVDTEFDGEALRLSFSAARGQGKLFGPSAHATLLAVGAAMENVTQAATALETVVNWELEDLAEGRPYARATLSGTACPRFVAEALALFGRHTNRHAYAPTPIPSPVLDKIAGTRVGDVRARVIQDAGDRHHLTRFARTAAEARFCTRELHDWLMGSLRFTEQEASRGDGLDIGCLDLPPGGSRFLKFISDWRRMAWLNRLGAYKALALTEVVLLARAPAFIAIVGPQTPPAIIDAGRAMERAWIALNAAGIAVHPYYVITDQLLRRQSNKIPDAHRDSISRMAEALPEVLGLQPGELLHIFLRIGHPTREPKRAHRLPLDAVFSETPGIGQ